MNNTSHSVTRVGNYKWFNMGSRPLKFDVKCGSKVVIAAGTKHVGIAFGQSHLTRIAESGDVVKCHVYRVRERGADGRYTVKLYHA